MTLTALIRTRSEVWERVRTLAQERRVRQAWPAMGGLLLLAPGMLTVGAFAPHTALAHVSGLNLDIAYATVVHVRQPTTLTLSTMSVFGAKGHFSLRLGQKLLENFSIVQITPEPIASSTEGGETIYSFSGGGKDAVTLTLMPKTLGKTAATLQYGLDTPIPFSITTVP